jgi:hypothetical protein
MTCRIILDADWFVIGGVKYIKQLAFALVDLPVSDQFTFSLPKFAQKYSKSLTNQARHSHGLIWHTKGDFVHNQVARAFDVLFERTGKKPSELEFYAKGLEKCRLLENFVPEVNDLDNYGCPRYGKLTILPQSTLTKAVTFAQWFGDGENNKCSSDRLAELPSGSSED